MALECLRVLRSLSYFLRLLPSSPSPFLSFFLFLSSRLIFYRPHQRLSQLPSSCSSPHSSPFPFFTFPFLVFLYFLYFLSPIVHIKDLSQLPYSCFPLQSSSLAFLFFLFSSFPSFLSSIALTNDSHNYLTPILHLSL